MADWSKLPYDIIHKVSNYLEAIEDFLAFSAVCSSWRSVYSAKQWHQGPQVPWLMLSSYAEDSSLRSFVSLYRNKVHNSELPEVSGRRCWGSSIGWLVTLGNDLKFHLLNPFTRVSLNLPPKSSLQIHFGEVMDWHEIVEKAFVFKKPCTSATQSNEEGLLVVIIHGPLKQLAFCRPGSSSWKSLHSHGGLIDVVCVKDQIFALSSMGYLLVVDVDNLAVTEYNRPHTYQQLFLSFPYWDWEQLFLVESSGDLWLVHQNETDLSRRSSVKSIEFLVYTFNFNRKVWTLLSDLGNHAIFVSDGCSISISDPELLNCKSNAIYFIRKNMEQRWPYREYLVDLGVYNVADGISQPLLSGPDMPPYHSFPLWVTPTLH